METTNEPRYRDPSREQIATFAYLIWEKEGRPEGRAVEHWLQAEAHLKLIGRQSAAKSLGLKLAAPPAVSAHTTARFVATAPVARSRSRRVFISAGAAV